MKMESILHDFYLYNSITWAIVALTKSNTCPYHLPDYPVSFLLPIHNACHSVWEQFSPLAWCLEAKLNHMHRLFSLQMKLKENLFVNNAGSIPQCWKRSIPNFNANNNRMHGGILQMLIEQEETFTEIPARSICQVTFNSLSSAISQVFILLWV